MLVRVVYICLCYVLVSWFSQQRCFYSCNAVNRPDLVGKGMWPTPRIWKGMLRLANITPRVWTTPIPGPYKVAVVVKCLWHPDGKKWYVKDRMGEYRRIRFQHKNNTVCGDTFYVYGDKGGKWYRIDIGLAGALEFKKFLLTLPSFTFEGKGLNLSEKDYVHNERIPFAKVKYFDG